MARAVANLQAGLHASRSVPQATSNTALHASTDRSPLGVAVQDALTLPGRPLDAGERPHLESFFQQDFSKVAVHSEGQAAESARMLDARAYTVGNHVVFAHGQYQPGTAAGRGLLAHELAHVVQQAGRSPNRIRALEVQPAGTPAEERADRASIGIASGGRAPTISRELGSPFVDRLQRQGPAPPSIPTTWGINLSIDEKGHVDVTVSGPSTTPIVSKPTIGIRRDADGKYHLLVGGRDRVVTADQIPEMLKSIGGTKPGGTQPSRRLVVPTCDQLADMGNKFENYELSRKLLEAPGVPIEMLPLTPELFDSLVVACTTRPAPVSAGPPTTPDVSLKVSPLLASMLGSDTLDNFGFDDAALTPAHVTEIDQHLGPRLQSLLSQYPLATVSVTGHTDEVGSDPYNKALGERRAESVRDRLAKMIPPEIISTDSVGKADPVVRTGKAEGRNRRVEIRFSTGLRIRGFGQPSSPPAPAPPVPSPEPGTQSGQKQPAPAPAATQPATPPREGAEAEPPESHVRLTVQLTPQHTFPLRGTNAAQCGDSISFPVGVMWNWDGIPLAGDKLQLFPQPEIDWDLVQVMCGKPGNVLVQDNLLKWNILKDVLELSLVGQVSIVQGSDLALQPGFQLSWHPLTTHGGNKELQLIFGTSLNWQPGPGNLGLVVGGGIRFELPH